MRGQCLEEYYGGEAKHCMLLGQKLQIPAVLQKPHVPMSHNSSHQCFPCCETRMGVTKPMLERSS